VAFWAGDEEGEGPVTWGHRHRARRRAATKSPRDDDARIAAGVPFPARIDFLEIPLGPVWAVHGP